MANFCTNQHQILEEIKGADIVLKASSMVTYNTQCKKWNLCCIHPFLYNVRMPLHYNKATEQKALTTIT